MQIGIVGGGPAGLTAALYAARAGLTVCVFDPTPGGQLVEAAEVENYPGVGRIAGMTLSDRFLGEAQAAGAELRQQLISRILYESGSFLLYAGEERHRAEAVILCNGAAVRKLNVPGEKEFLGHGVSYCAVCDGRFFGGKAVAVVGGGDSALTEALYLARTASVVHVLNRSEHFRGSPALLQRLHALPNVLFHTSVSVREIKGEKTVQWLELSDKLTNTVYKLAVQGVFIAIGREPNNEPFSALFPLDDVGYIRTGEECRVGIPGLFAAGDTRSKSLRQLVTAISDGAVAAEGARKFLASLKNQSENTAAKV